MSSSTATAATAGNGTITGIGTTMNFAFVIPSSGQGLLGVAFPTCIPATSPNTAIIVTQPAGGAGVAVASVSAWGCQQ
jgi:hypothetical protein